MNAAGVTRRRFGQLVGGCFAALGLGFGPARASVRPGVEVLGGDGWRLLPGVVWTEEQREWIEFYRSLHPRAAAVKFEARWYDDDFARMREPFVHAWLVDREGEDVGCHFYGRRGYIWERVAALKHVRLEAGDAGRVSIRSQLGGGALAGGPVRVRR